MERIAMSQEERDELDWLKRVKAGSITQREAAQKMGVSDRWVRELLKRMSKQGDAVVVHGLRGRPSNRKLSAETQRQALAILKQPDWHDFGPTFAAEQLGKRHQIEVGKETLRGWMIEAGMWKSNSRRLQEIHCWRPRRSAFGELVQWDTSEHDWLEGRGPVRYLVRMIDDATSWSWGRFVERDATPHNMGVLWEYLEKNGRMVDVYTDRDSMFTVPPRPAESAEQRREADRLTQLGRALRELGIGSILAYSPQAKGRIERSFLTAQDRLVKHLRLAKVNDSGKCQCVSGERILAGMEYPFRSAGSGLSQSASRADAAVGLGRDSESRRRAGNRQRLHVQLRGPSLPDRALPSASWDAAPAAARRTPSRRGVEGALPRAIRGDRRVRRAGHRG